MKIRLRILTVKRDVNKLAYGYRYLDHYWTEERRWAYFIVVDGKLAGFAMVISLPVVDDRETDFQLSEFCVLPKYRRQGVGRQAFFKVLDLHMVRWQLVCHPANTTSVRFWDKVINEYTKGRYELVKSHPEARYEDGSPGNVYFFDS